MAHTNTKMPKTLQEIGNLDIEHLSQERISEIVTFIASNLKQQNVTRKPKMHKITTKDGQWPIKENLTAEDAVVWSLFVYKKF